MKEFYFDPLPRHLAIIMDGNGRWAKARGLPRVAGHKRGSDAVRKVVTRCRELGIEVLSLFAFSSQNWSRPGPEVSALMSLLSTYLKKERSTIMDNDIRLTAVGELDKLPRQPRQILQELIDLSSTNRGMTLCLSLSYGGREEVVAMARRLSRLVETREISSDSVDENIVDQLMWTSKLGPVDLMIRTSGELRISNFILWGLAYSELYFTDVMWPDFDEKHLLDALREYSQRHRRFGSVVT